MQPDARAQRERPGSNRFERQTFAFVVRVWAEPANGDAQPRWRVQLEQVGTGETAVFQLPPALIEFLLEGLVDSVVFERPRAGRMHDAAAIE